MAKKNLPTLRNGSTGTDVKNLQAALKEQGYDVGNVDGVYGSKTTAAVKQYQKDNGLAVDGIAGKNTLGSLGKHFDTSIGPTGATATNPVPKKTTGGSTTTKTTTNTATQTGTQTTAGTPTATNATAGKTQPETPKASQNTGTAPAAFSYDAFTYDPFSYADYAQSDVVKQANALLQQHSANKPGAYQSQWQGQIDAAYDAYANRDPFSYNFNTDALYQQYKDNYIQQGRMAMMDTMGQAAAMTGGYGNSYAQTVGQQAYNQQLNQLNDVIPELHQMAYDQYEREGTNLYNQYNMLLAKENKDYARYQDNLSNWYKDLQYLTDRYETESAADYDKWLTGRNQAYNEYVADKNLAYDEYNVGRDQAWDEYVAEQERAEKAATLMAGIGNYDRLGDVYGLSSSEVAAIEKANAPKPTGGGGGGNGTKAYTKLTYGSDEYNAMVKEIGRATSLDELNYITSNLLNFGYDPSQIKSIAQQQIDALTPQSNTIDTGVPIVSKGGLPTAEELKKQRQQENRAKNKQMTIY